MPFDLSICLISCYIKEVNYIAVHSNYIFEKNYCTRSLKSFDLFRYFILHILLSKQKIIEIAGFVCLSITIKFWVQRSKIKFRLIRQLHFIGWKFESIFKHTIWSLLFVGSSLSDSSMIACKINNFKKLRNIFLKCGKYSLFFSWIPHFKYKLQIWSCLCFKFFTCESKIKLLKWKFRWEVWLSKLQIVNFEVSTLNFTFESRIWLIFFAAITLSNLQQP